MAGKEIDIISWDTWISTTRKNDPSEEIFNSFFWRECQFILEFKKIVPFIPSLKKNL